MEDSKVANPLNKISPSYLFRSKQLSYFSKVPTTSEALPKKKHISKATKQKKQIQRPLLRTTRQESFLTS